MNIDMSPNNGIHLNGSVESQVEYPYVPMWALVIFCGYVIIWYLQIGYRVPALGAIRFEFIYAAFLSIIAIATGGLAQLSSPLIKYCALLLLCMFIQVPFSYDVTTSWTVFFDRVVKFAFMALFIVSFVRSPRDLIFFLGAFLLACLKMGQEGFWGQVTGGLVWQNQGIMRLHGATPLYEHPNSFAGMALGTLPFIYYLFPLANRWIKIVLLVLFGFSMLIVLFTGSRTGYVALCFIILFIIVRSKNRIKVLAVLTAVSLIAIPLVPDQYTERFHSIFTGRDREGQSTEMRKEILQDAWQIFKSHPFGVGVSAFPAIRLETYGRSQDTHNLYLEVATNLGIQGFIVFALFIIQMILTLHRVEKSTFSQRISLEGFLARSPPSLSKHLLSIESHIADLRLLQYTCIAITMFITIRLALGLFGMDLYEIYWWFAFGLTITVYHMNDIAYKKTENMLTKMCVTGA